jgi:hypothetical protein
MGNHNQPAVLLLDRDFHSKAFVKTWLGKHGFVVADADDMSGLIEEVTDFTVRSNADVVLFETDGLPCFDSFNSVLSSSDLGTLNLVALSNADCPDADNGCVARTLDEAKLALSATVKPLSYAA